MVKFVKLIMKNIDVYNVINMSFVVRRKEVYVEKELVVKMKLIFMV